MGKIWEEENKFRIWLEIEILACEAQAELGVIPREAVRTIRERARFDVARIDEIEREVKHDVIAFLTNVGEYVGPEARFIHLGMTSSDVLDTCLAVQMKQSGDLLLEGLRGWPECSRRRAKEFKTTVMVGRTHGIHAEPTTFGLKLALWYDETQRNIARLEAGRRKNLRRDRSPAPSGRSSISVPKSKNMSARSSASHPRRSRRRSSSATGTRNS